MKSKIVLFSFPSIHPNLAGGFLVVRLLPGHFEPALRHASVLISPEPGAASVLLVNRSGPLRDLARTRAGWYRPQAAEDGSLQRPADRPKAGCQLCQDDRQAVGCRLNRGEHCVLYLFILSAGGGPDPPWPAARAGGRDGESGRRKACREFL